MTLQCIPFRIGQKIDTYDDNIKFLHNIDCLQVKLVFDSVQRRKLKAVSCHMSDSSDLRGENKNALKTELGGSGWWVAYETDTTEHY